VRICITSLIVWAMVSGGQPPASPRQNAKASAPIDLTGYWVSVVTEDWPWRMVTPSKGDASSVPLNDEGRRVTNAWDPAKDEATGSACKSYGAAHIMRVPGRLHVTWESDDVLKIDTDAGQQTRLLRFGGSPPPAGDVQWQGESTATWERGTLKVVTRRMKAGYLRKNGVPYSENAVMTEYFDAHTESNGAWFTVTTIVEDPKYLQQPFVTSSDFRKEPDGAKWHPVPCTAR
jgi:hypothetical protein